MAYLTENDFRKLAEAVSDDLINNEIPLNDSISKLASDMGLTQEQVCRLCESTNNVTFNKLFQSRDKTAKDRMIEFPVADAKKILAGQIKEAAVVPSVDSVNVYELRPLESKNDSSEEFQKVAFELRPEIRPSREVDVRTARKTCEHMRSLKLATDMQYQDSVTSLRDRFRRLYDVPPFNEFEKNAVARYGEAASVPLAEARQLLRLPAVEYDFSKLAKTAGFVDDSTVEMKLLNNAIEFRKTSMSLQRGIEKLEKLL